MLFVQAERFNWAKLMRIESTQVKARHHIGRRPVVPSNTKAQGLLPAHQHRDAKGEDPPYTILIINTFSRQPPAQEGVKHFQRPLVMHIQTTSAHFNRNTELKHSFSHYGCSIFWETDKNCVHWLCKILCWIETQTITQNSLL